MEVNDELQLAIMMPMQQVKFKLSCWREILIRRACLVLLANFSIGSFLTGATY